MFVENLISGLVMGMASGLHCAGMCGPIGCMLLLGSPVATRSLDPSLLLMSAQGGRIASYVLLGTLFGVFGSGLYGVLNLQAAHQALQWSAGATIVWMGLSIAGLAPAIPGFDRLLAPAAGAVASVRARWLGGYPQLGVAGLIWGLTPCAMVYAALFNSLLAGSSVGGATVMLGFGLGTVPAVVVSSFGLFRIGKLTATRAARTLAGAVLAGAGTIGLLLTVPGSPLCIG
jgi:sulfite exporter TauE/SafE